MRHMQPSTAGGGTSIGHYLRVLGDEEASDRGGASGAASGSADAPSTPRPLRTSTRPVSAFSGEATGNDPALGNRLEKDVDEFFHRQALRRELPPDEFMSIAALFGIPYAAAAVRPRSVPLPTPRGCTG